MSGDLQTGWFKASRGETPIELIHASPNAFLLAYVMAHRARWREGFNRHGLGQGEAMLGDFESYGMTEQQYRTAKAQLQKWKFATFKTTNKGTVGKLIDTRLFSTSIDDSNGQVNRQATDSQRTANGQLTTNEEYKKGKSDKNEKGEPPPRSISNGNANGIKPGRISATERISFEKEIESIREIRNRIKNRASQDAFGPKFTDQEKTKLAALSKRESELKMILGRQF